DTRAERFRAVLEAEVPSLVQLVAGTAGPRGRKLLLGEGALPSGIEWAGVGAASASELEADHARLREQAAVVVAAPVVCDPGEIIALGPATLVRSFARALVLRAAAAVPPGGGHIVVPADEAWASELPHPV